MKQPTLNGRKLPRNDWEGDDRTPGANGHYVTCQDTAVGRMVAFATNGRVDLDGSVYRAAVVPPDSNGTTLAQHIRTVRKLADRELVVPKSWTWAQCLAHLRAGKGLVIDGIYATIPRAYRYQASADFGHAIWFSHYSPTSGVRTWDPLNPDIHAYGRWLPLAAVKAFAMSWLCIVGYVPLDPIDITTGSVQTAHI